MKLKCAKEIHNMHILATITINHSTIYNYPYLHNSLVVTKSD